MQLMRNAVFNTTFNTARQHKLTIWTPSCRLTPLTTSQHSVGVHGDAILTGTVDKYGGITINLPRSTEKQSLDIFKQQLQDSLRAWKRSKLRSVWLNIPLHQSHLIQIAAEEGFLYHHTDPQLAVLNRWIEEGTESSLPIFVTHQVGVAGIAIREDTQQVLVVKDRLMRPQVWKFPGGVSDLGEDIAETAVREVFEETGVRTEFRSVVAFRQQHDQPGTFGRSDIYVVCRMRPLTTEINACTREVSDCAWMHLDELAEQIPLAPITNRFINLIRRGLNDGFHTIDMERSELKSVYKGKIFRIYHAALPESYR